MTRSALIITLALLVSLPVLAALKVGEKAPDFSSLCSASLAGKEFKFSLPDALKKGPVVVYFYPSAYTNGGDIEAHAFAEMKDQFDAASAAYHHRRISRQHRPAQRFLSRPGLLRGKVPGRLGCGCQGRNLLQSDQDRLEAWPERCARRRN